MHTSKRHMTKNMFARNSVGHPAPPLCLSLPEAEVWFGVSLSLAGSSPLPEKDRIWFGLLLAVPRRATSRPKQSSHFFGRRKGCVIQKILILSSFLSNNSWENKESLEKAYLNPRKWKSISLMIICITIL